ncbi:MAG TPA: hypothetical protein VFF67_09090 [Thermoplasmata archaeon]|nr:hypothetical protein [Thermoplasmata archaeon]
MRSRSGRGASPIYAQLFIVGMTIAAGSVLWLFRPPVPPQPASLEYFAFGGQSEQTWGDGSDCKNVNGEQNCLSIGAIDIVLTQWSPDVLPIGSVSFYLICNGTVYLSATLRQMAWIPGSQGTPAGNAPQLGVCGKFVPPAAAFNRLAFFEQLNPNSTDLVHGDEIVLFEPFEPPNCPSPKYRGAVLVACDDDFHGAPGWCFSIPSACSIDLVYTGPPSTVVTEIPLFGLGS